MTDEPTIDELRQAWQDEGIPPEDIEKLTEIYYNTTQDGAEAHDDAMDADIPDKDEDEQSPPSDTESDPPMPSEPGPEDPDEDKYNPERNVDEDGGGVGTDPPCKPIFEPSVARMKRGKIYTMWVPGGPDGYEARRADKDNKRAETVGMYKGTIGPNLVKFQGRTDIRVSPGTPTPLFMPTDEVVITDYSCNDGSELVFWRNAVNMVYCQARSGHERPVTLNYTVYVMHESRIGNLRYYYQDYDDSMTVQDAYTSASDPECGFDFDQCLDASFRRNVPDAMRVINETYFQEFITVLDGMTVPGMPVTDPDRKAMDDARKKYNLKRFISVLAGHCMSYGCGDIPKGDMMLACARSREGACRNRAVVFMVVANTVGIPTRYVTSDCHAYVEVYFGNIKRWVGMDLGGCPPPQPKDPDGNPIPAPGPDKVLDKFKSKLLAMGWKAGDDKYELAMLGAKKHLGLG